MGSMMIPALDVASSRSLPDCTGSLQKRPSQCQKAPSPLFDRATAILRSGPAATSAFAPSGTIQSRPNARTPIEKRRNRACRDTPSSFRTGRRTTPMPCRSLSLEEKLLEGAFASRRGRKSVDFGRSYRSPRAARRAGSPSRSSSGVARSFTPGHSTSRSCKSRSRDCQSSRFCTACPS